MLMPRNYLIWTHWRKMCDLVTYCKMLHYCIFSKNNYSIQRAKCIAHFNFIWIQFTAKKCDSLKFKWFIYSWSNSCDFLWLLWLKWLHKDHTRNHLTNYCNQSSVTTNCQNIHNCSFTCFLVVTGRECWSAWWIVTTLIHVVSWYILLNLCHGIST